MIFLIKYSSIILFAVLLICPILVSLAQAGMNLVANPSFENGNTVPLNWTFVTRNGNTPIWDYESHSGSKSIKISVPGKINAISGYPKSSLIKAQPLTKYIASAWGRTQNAGGANMPAVRVFQLDANKNLLTITSLFSFGKGTNDWTRKSTEFQTRPDTRYLYVYANIWNGNGTFWVDDVNISLKSTGRTFYVAKNGNDKNPGTEKSPFLTIQKAANMANTPGDTVYVKNGTYYEYVIIKYSGTAKKPITFKNFPNNVVTLTYDWKSMDTKTGIKGAGLFSIWSKQYVVIDGFRLIKGSNSIIIEYSDSVIVRNNYIENPYRMGIYIGGNLYNNNNMIIEKNTVNRFAISSTVEYAEMISISYAKNATIRNNHVKANSKGECIVVKTLSRDIHIYNNTVEKCAVGIYAGSDGYFYIYNNLARNMRGAGMSVSSEIGRYTHDIKLYNNIAYDNKGAGFALSGYTQSGNFDVWYKNISFINNVAYHNGWAGGIELDMGSDGHPIRNIIVRNNILKDNYPYQIMIRPGNPGLTYTIENNLIDGPNYLKFPYYNWRTANGTNYKTGDPLFVNLANHDFHLKNGSKAIDKGILKLAPNFDFYGNPRPKGINVDIGVHEK